VCVRRIYDSGAVRREDGPGTPAAREQAAEPQTVRWLDAESWSRRLVPAWLRRRAISVRVVTPGEDAVFSREDGVPFEVRMKNALPVPVTLRTTSPLLWSWSVDGAVTASRVWAEPEGKARAFQFDRGERKRFRKRWDGLFQVSEREWAPAPAGEYTIGAAVNVASGGLRAETTVELTD